MAKAASAVKGRRAREVFRMAISWVKGGPGTSAGAALATSFTRLDGSVHLPGPACPVR